MKLNSKYFDHIRVKRSSRSVTGKKPKSEDVVLCAHEGCDRVGAYQTRKPGGGAGEYSYFCLDHTRLLHGLRSSSSAAEAAIADLNFADIGERPTWPFGKAKDKDSANGKGKSRAEIKDIGRGAFSGGTDHFIDPFGIYAGRLRCEAYARARESESSHRPVGIAVRRALERLGLDESASAEDVRERYKVLLKRYHPDSNGGSREGEALLRSVISAYSELKSHGFV